MALEDLFLTYVETRGMKMPEPKRGKKFKEEAGEFLEALEEYNNACETTNGKLIDNSRLHLMEEAADVIFALAALARMNKFTLEEAMALKTMKDKDRNRKK